MSGVFTDDHQIIRNNVIVYSGEFLARQESPGVPNANSMATLLSTRIAYEVLEYEMEQFNTAARVIWRTFPAIAFAKLA